MTGSAYSGYVVAGIAMMSEDEGEYFEPSAVWPDSR